MQMKDKESFMCGGEYAAGIIGLDGPAFLQDEYPSIYAALTDRQRKDLLVGLAALIQAYFVSLNKNNDWDAVGIKFEE